MTPEGAKLSIARTIDNKNKTVGGSKKKKAKIISNVLII